MTRLAGISTDAAGSTAINGGTVNTTGAQTYNDDVTIGADLTLDSSVGGNIILAKTVNGANSLLVNTAGTTTFGKQVGNSAALASVTTDAAGTTAINGGLVNTTGTQTYNDDVILGAGATLISSGVGASGNVTLNKTINGAQSLSVFSGGTTTFGGAVGNSTRLTSVNTDAAGTTVINGGAVNTTGAQTFSDDVTLGADTTLDSSASGNITLAKTVNGARNLVVNTAGATTFGKQVGNNTALVSVTTDAAGTTAVNGGVVNTTGTQTYNDDVTLGADALLVSTGAGANGNITFGKTVNGARSLRACFKKHELFGIRPISGA